MEPAPVSPIKEPATAPWCLRISDRDFWRLRDGFRPENMDDKWYFYASGRDPPLSVQIARSALNFDCFVLDIILIPAADGIGKIAEIATITWETGTIGKEEEEAKKQAVMITRSVLFCHLDLAPEYE